MSFLSKIFAKKQKSRDAMISLIGPSKAGKTTLVKYLETGEAVHEEFGTTLGIEVRRNSVEISGWKLNAIDTGGQELYQQTFWELAVQQADAVIFVIDATVRESSNPEIYEVSKNQFAYALDIVPETVPLLVLLNKQDLIDHDPMGPKEALTIFNMALFQNRTVAYLPISAKYGDGVQDALEWLIDKLD
ncbi:MAG: GTP-binding protein [Candidatus Heimdallarchaeota archaeon]|nr:GTP-binding protein [Candidatus Heimdallarchaeota archaeon]